MIFLQASFRQIKAQHAIVLFVFLCNIFYPSTATFGLYPCIPLPDTIPKKITATNINDSGSPAYDTPPTYPGGSMAWLRNMSTGRSSSMQKGLEGRVIVRFTVSEKGKLSDFNAVGDSEKAKKEAVRIIKNNGRWKPALLDGNPVTAQVEQAITFKQAYY